MTSLSSYSLCRARVAVILLTVLSAHPLHAAPDDAPRPIVTATIRVRHSKASRVASQLLTFNRSDGAGDVSTDLPFLLGVKSLSADDKAGHLTVRGDKASINRLRQLVTLLDQKTSELTLRATISSAPYTTNDAVTLRTTPLATTDTKINNLETVQIPLSAAGVAVQCGLSARINGDRSVTLSYVTDTHWRISQPAMALDNQQHAKSTRRLKVGETYRVPLAAVQTLPDQVVTRQQYYLELTPIQVKVP